MSSGQLPVKTHLAALDGLRGAAAIAILSLHVFNTLGSPPYLPYAHLAVDFFFLLSGFVIAKAYEDRLLKSLSFGRFCTIRLIRLYPLIVVGALLGSVSLLLHALSQHEYGIGKALLASLAAMFLVPTSLLAPENIQIFPANPPEWSLFFEMAVNIFYGACIRWLTSRNVRIVCLISGAALLWIAVQTNGLDIGYSSQNFWYGFVRVTFPFLLGVLLFRLPRNSWLHPKDFTTLLLAALLLCLLMMPMVKYSGLFEAFIALIVFPVIVFLAAACQNGPIFGRICLWLGQLSYPLYITHGPVVRIVSKCITLSKIHWPVMATAAVCATVAVVTSYALLKLFDEPVRQRLTSRLLPRPVVVA